MAYHKIVLRDHTQLFANLFSNALKLIAATAAGALRRI